MENDKFVVNFSFLNHFVAPNLKRKKKITETMGKFFEITRKLSNQVRSRRRVVITGMGIVSPLGCGIETAWKSLLAGKSGVVKLEGPDYEKLPCRIGKITIFFQLNSFFV